MVRCHLRISHSKLSKFSFYLLKKNVLTSVCVLQYYSDTMYVFHSEQWKQRLQEKYQ